MDVDEVGEADEGEDEDLSADTPKTDGTGEAALIPGEAGSRSISSICSYENGALFGRRHPRRGPHPAPHVHFFLPLLRSPRTA